MKRFCEDKKMGEPWDKLPEESSKAYNMFCQYRDMGPSRSLENLRRLSDKYKTKDWLGIWSSKYHWVERASAYDEYLEKLQRKTREEELIKMVERHIEEAMALQSKAAKRLDQLEPSELSPKDVLNYFLEAIKLERLSRGEPTEIAKEEITLPKVIEIIPDDRTNQ